MVDAVDVPVGEGLDLLEAGLVLQLLEAGLGGGLIGLVAEVDVAGLGGVLDLLLLPLAAGGDDVLGVGGDDLLGGEDAFLAGQEAVGDIGAAGGGDDRAEVRGGVGGAGVVDARTAPQEGGGLGGQGLHLLDDGVDLLLVEGDEGLGLLALVEQGSQEGDRGDGVLHRVTAEVGDDVGDLLAVELVEVALLLRGVVDVQGHDEDVGLVLHQGLDGQVVLGDGADDRQIGGLRGDGEDLVVEVRGGLLQVLAPGDHLVDGVVLVEEDQGVDVPGLAQDDVLGLGIEGDLAANDVGDLEASVRGARGGASAGSLAGAGGDSTAGEDGGEREGHEQGTTAHRSPSVRRGRTRST